MKNRTVSLILYRQKKSSKNFRSLRKKRKISATIENVNKNKKASISSDQTKNLGFLISSLSKFIIYQSIMNSQNMK